jgi:glutaredoxin-like protein
VEHHDSLPPEVVPPLPEGLEGGAAVTVLWRPGCPYCALLLRGLSRTGLRFDRIDIWEEPAAAAWLRVVADGNETVPTVRIVGGDPDAAVALVNPSVTQVLAAVERVAPAALPSASRPSWLARLLRVRGRRGRDRGPAAPR